MQIETLIPDAKLEKDGKWIDWPEADGVSFLIGYYGSEAYDTKLRALATKARRRSYGRELPPKVQQKIELESIVGTLLLDWKGLEDGYENGKGIPLPFSVEAATDLLRKSKKLRDFITVEATQLENFRPTEMDVESEVTDGGSPKELGDGASAELKSGSKVVAEVG